MTWRPRARPGVSLVELLITLTLTGVLGTIAITTIVGAQRFTRHHTGRVAAAEATRVSAAVLAAEIRYLAPHLDIYGLGRDSIALRAFRGTAIVCANAGPEVLVRYRGVRGPEPVKDSLVMVASVVSHGGTGAQGWIGAESAIYPLLASSAAAAGCTTVPGEALYRWTIDPAPPPGTLFLLFESGSYHLTRGALRYRRGAAGRQPLTNEILDDHAVGLQWIATGDASSIGSGHGSGDGMLSEQGPTVAAMAIRLGTKPLGPAQSSTIPGVRHWIGLPNGDAWLR